MFGCGEIKPLKTKIWRWHSLSSHYRLVAALLLLVGMALMAGSGDGDSIAAGIGSDGQAGGEQEGQVDLLTATRLKEQASARLARKAGSEARFREVARRERSAGVVPVIVNLRVSFQPESELNDEIAIRAQRTVIRRVRDRVVDGIVGYDPVSIKEFESLPFLAVRVNETGVESLRTSTEVLDIQEDYLHRPSLAQSVALIGANNAWARGYGGAGQTVAILDTGVDKSHPFLAGKVVAEACFSTTAGGSTSVCPGGASSSTVVNAGLPCSLPGECDHGTHVAGIVAGKGSSFSGVARDANLIAIQVFSRFESRTDCEGSAPCVMSYSSDIIRGLQRVYELRSTFQIAAANLSLGGGEYKSACDSRDAATKAAIDLLRSVGIATTAASGNESFTDALSSPACISTAISVGSVSDTTAGVSSFSNSASFLNLLAPGGGISSSVPGAGFETWSGTSMASPHVAGAWAILKQRVPAASVTQVLEALTSTGLAVTDARNRIVSPLIKVDAALAALGSGGPPPGLPAVPTALTAIVSSTTQINLSWMDNSTDEAGFKVYRRAAGENTWTLLSTLAPNTVTFANTGLTPGTTFTYQVTAFNNAGESSPSNEITAITLASPTPPTGLTARADSSNRITLNWTDSSNNESGFRIRRRTTTRGSWTVIGTVGQNVTSFQSAGLNPGQIYYFVVTSFSSVAESPFSNQASATTSGTVPPSAPSNLSASGVTPTQVDLSWTDNSGDETGFRISRKVGAAGAWAVVGTAAAGATSIRNTGLTPATLYFYRVTAFNNAGESAASNEAQVITPDVSPAAPSGLTVVAASSRQANLAWRDNSGNETAFRIERRTGVAGSWEEIARVGANVALFQNSGLAPRTTYAYRVAALNEFAISAPSNEAEVTTPAETPEATPTAPGGLQGTATSTTQVYLAWVDTSSNETGFRVERRAGSTGGWSAIFTTPTGVTNYANSDLVGGATYTYRIRAVNGLLESAPTPEVTVTVPLNSFTTLTRGQAVSGRVARGENLYYKLYVPPGATQLVFQTSGTGDIDLYVRQDSQPGRSVYGCRSVASNSTERCTISAPTAGDWHVLVYGFGSTTNMFTLTPNYQVGTTARVQSAEKSGVEEADDQRPAERPRGLSGRP